MEGGCGEGTGDPGKASGVDRREEIARPGRQVLDRNDVAGTTRVPRGGPRRSHSPCHLESMGRERIRPLGHAGMSARPKRGCGRHLLPGQPPGTLRQVPGCVSGESADPGTTRAAGYQLAAWGKPRTSVSLGFQIWKMGTVVLAWPAPRGCDGRPGALQTENPGMT